MSSSWPGTGREEDPRARWIANTCDILALSGGHLEALLNRPRDWRERQARTRALAGARELYWEPYHYGRAGEAESLDGRLLFAPSQAHPCYPLEVSCMGASCEWIEQDARAGGIMVEEPDSYRLTPAVILPTQVLSPSLVQLGLRLWYMQHFQLSQGSWAVLEARLPLIHASADWAQPVSEEPEAGERRRERVRHAHRAMNQLLHAAEQSSSSQLSPPWHYYGVSLDELLLPET